MSDDQVSSQEEPESQISEQPQTAVTVTEAREVTRARAKDFKNLVASYIRRHLPVSDPKDESKQEPPRVSGSHANLLPLLQIIPWMLALMFGASFLWDFPGIQWQAFGQTFVLDGLMRIVAVSGMIGFLTNWVAITMLFNPRQVRPVFGQGLIPAQRERVIYRLATAVSEELINEEIIKQKIEENEIIPKYRELAMSVARGVLEDQEFRTDLKRLTADYVETVLTSDEVRKRIVEFVVEKIEAYVGQGVGGMALKAYRYLNEDDFKQRIDKAIHGIPSQLDIVLDEMDLLLDKIPEKIEARSEDIEEFATRIVLGFVENLDVYDMVMTNMMAYDEGRLETLIKKSSNEQLNYIKYLGGVLGAVGGLVIWQPVPALIAFTGIGALLFTLDEALFRMRRGREETSSQTSP
ncbi:MAG: DUF445 family protein [Bacteroidetes bacterium]|nr:DUF445 family protein [Bacteroidota bacterium]MDA1332721.1 DUF445 family protein [Bacteroidota bacterium]